MPFGEVRKEGVGVRVGGVLIRRVLIRRVLSGALSRDPSSQAAQELAARGAEVVAADGLLRVELSVSGLAGACAVSVGFAEERGGLGGLLGHRWGLFGGL